MGSLFSAFAPGTKIRCNPSRVSSIPFSEPAIHVGDTFTLNFGGENVFDLAGWQFDISFDPDALEAV